ncbi:MAG TPA: hypothetical protein VHU85_08240 [Acidimicrobiales bacterium]|jgi:hypothetical protein|nr:hypothetical protein [Acidimicrobiales bacterium]
MDLWLRLLLDPVSVIGSKAKSSPERRGIALLLDGQFLQYTRSAEELQLPSLVGPPPSTERGDRGLLAALVSTLRGEPDTQDRYDNLLKSWKKRDGRFALASVLASMHAAEGGNSSEAAAILDRARPPSSSWSVALDLHLGIRWVELDLPKAGLDATRRAIHAIDKAGPRAEVSGLLAWTAYSNEFHFAFMMGEPARRDHNDMPTSSAISEIDLRLRQGLAAYLDGNYSESFRDIRTRFMSFSAEDPVSSKLDAALLRAECLADWQLLAGVRRWSGRWQLLNALGREGSNPEQGFELLRRAHDNEGLERGMRFAQQVGPLRAIRNTGTMAVRSNWSDVDRESSLIEVRESADVLTTETAGEAIVRLTSNWVQLSKPLRTTYVAHRVIETIAALLVSADPEYHNLVSRFYLGLVLNESGGLELQTIARSLHSIDWSLVSDDVRRGWLEFTTEYLGARSDQGMVAFEAVVSVSAVDESNWIPLVEQRYRDTNQVDLAAILLGSKTSIPADVVTTFVEQVLASVSDVATSARQGSHGIGARVHLPTLLCQLHFEYPELVPWARVADFLYEPSVSVDDKRPVVEALARSISRLTPEERGALIANRGPMSIAVAPFGDGSVELDGALFRLFGALGQIEDGEVLSQMLLWSGSADALHRMEAANSVLFIDPSRVSDALAVLIIGLTRDTNPPVRLQAAYGLASKDWGVSQTVRSTVNGQLLKLMAETDSRVPLAIMDALAAQARLGHDVPEGLLNHASLLASEHLSAVVRAAAVALKRAVDEQTNVQSGQQAHSEDDE